MPRRYDGLKNVRVRSGWEPLECKISLATECFDTASISMVAVRLGNRPVTHAYHCAGVCLIKAMASLKQELFFHEADVVAEK